MAGNRIENISDQVDGFAFEVANAIRDVMKTHNLTFEQAARVVELGIENMKTDELHHLVEEGITVHHEVDNTWSVSINGGADLFHRFENILATEVRNKA